MPSDAISGVGTLFQIGDGNSASEQFSSVAEINTISGPNITRDVIDVTSLDSTDGWREFIAGFRDGGEVTLELNFTIAGYDKFLDYLQLDESNNYQCVLPDTTNTTLGYAAIITNLGLAVPTDSKVTQSVTLKVTGAVTLTS